MLYAAVCIVGIVVALVAGALVLLSVIELNAVLRYIHGG